MIVDVHPDKSLDIHTVVDHPTDINQKYFIEIEAAIELRPDYCIILNSSTHNISI